MNKKKFKYIYGPVASWRLGRSLGIDLLSLKSKTCTFDCVYCQLGRAKKFSGPRKVFVAVGQILKELALLPVLKINYITFSGSGEPTLAKNLAQAIREVRKIRKEDIAVITNASLLDREEVKKDLLLADFVLIKLDVASQELLCRINRPMERIKFDSMIKAIKEFRVRFKGKLALQIMLVKENRLYARELAVLAKEIRPDEIQLNTPLRFSTARPLSKKEVRRIKNCFERECGNKIKIISVYDSAKGKITPINRLDTLKRRGV